MTSTHTTSELSVAPGSVVVVRDEEWLVTGVEHTQDGALLTVQGLSELVRDSTATFYENLDRIEPHNPAEARVVGDPSPRYRTARLWLEATLRKTAIPLDSDELTVSTQMLADALGYQQDAVRKALDPTNLRPRILLADAVGLGKTLEIGMILAELVRRGRGDRILIVSPRHVLEQMQHEMWSRFALPFVRLDSVGIQRVRQKLPATRNPFTFYKRVIISVDTLKSDRYLAHLRQHRWDAVVIDESHNVTNSSTQNNRLARVLAPNTDALILASATPHNGRAESFAELIRLLEPTAVRPDGSLIDHEVERLIVRRHRHSPEVAKVVGADWAERKQPQNFLVPASAAENAIARELDEVWLHPRTGTPPYSGNTALFPWTLAKAFLSSPAALEATIEERLKRLAPATSPAKQFETTALHQLLDLTRAALAAPSAKYDRLVDYLAHIGVANHAPNRAVIFAERVPTLRWLAAKLRRDLNMDESQVRILHGGLTDQEQQEIVESFKQSTSPIRVLVTGDVASEGVNLHLQCHELIHFDIPWSLIRIEQRNGRIDRYGQRHSPQITTLLLEPDSQSFSGDLRVLSKLIEKEHEAHTALGDVASLMGKYDVSQEEDEIKRVLAGQRELEDVVATPEETGRMDPVAALLAKIMGSAATPPTPVAHPDTPADGGASSLFGREVDFLREALEEAFITPGAPVTSQGVELREYPEAQIIQFRPPKDLIQRLEVLPQSYLQERRVQETLKLVTATTRGKTLLKAALSDESDSTWPEAHYLGPLHPVLDWAADRALASLGRNQVFAVRGTVDHPTVLLAGTLTNKRGHVVSSSFLSVEFPNPANPSFAPITPYESGQEMVQAVGLDAAPANPGAPAHAEALQPLVAHAVAAARTEMAQVFAASAAAATERVEAWSRRAEQWEDEADTLIQRRELKARRVSVEEEARLAAAMAPDRQLVRPLLVVVPPDHPVASTEENHAQQ